MLLKRLACLMFVGILGVACSDGLNKSDGERLSKEEAAARQDGIDYCAVYDWYGDGVCDRFCLNLDPDCGGIQPPPPQPRPQPRPEPIPEPRPEPIPMPELCPEDNSEEVTYFSRNPEVCMQDEIPQVCPEGTQNFFSEFCGCGCIGTPTCEDSPTRFYVAQGDTCGVIFFSCDPGWSYFQDQCGCGCERPEICENRANKDYIANPQECMLIDFDCGDGYKNFEDDCGCGCERDAPPHCLAMNVRAHGPCDAELGVMFTGSECVTISGCSCAGSDCELLYDTLEECAQKTAECEQ